MKGRPSLEKRRKERARQDKKKDKADRRADRRVEKSQKPRREGEDDPDIAGIVPGPQPEETEIEHP
jgi:hypothetical protein